ncbi:signal peptidase I [Raineyella sp. LH-20]|uniref:signal peptidase I n=1 Tax=Raineyella sp. LH-20 TaxID=3081204 RepID=UPI00295545CB|nr:signal peptidase I [Raineyella sp. LH-20]WOP18410.1 signal peptidase I [Raineyella sp. LH-20]
MDNPREYTPTFSDRIWRTVKEAVIILVGAVLVSSVLQHFVGQMFLIPSGSMEHTLDVGDRVIAQKVVPVHRGDVVVFRDSAGWLGPEPVVKRGPVGHALELVGVLPDTSQNYLIKRVIGMPGDTVACCDAVGHLTVNGQSVDEQAYLYRTESGEQVLPSDIRFRVVVPAGRIFVMGDHRNASADSRCHLADDVPGEPLGADAFVPLTDVAGVGWAIFAPFNRTKVLPKATDLAQVPAATTPAPDQASIEPAGVTC